MLSAISAVLRTELGMELVKNIHEMHEGLKDLFLSPCATYYNHELIAILSLSAPDRMGDIQVDPRGKQDLSALVSF